MGEFLIFLKFLTNGQFLTNSKLPFTLRCRASQDLNNIMFANAHTMHKQGVVNCWPWENGLTRLALDLAQILAGSDSFIYSNKREKRRVETSRVCKRIIWTWSKIPLVKFHKNEHPQRTGDGHHQSLSILCASWIVNTSQFCSWPLGIKYNFLVRRAYKHKPSDSPTKI